MQINAKALNNAIRALSPLTKSSKVAWIVVDGVNVDVRAAHGGIQASVTLYSGADVPPQAHAVDAATLARMVRGAKGTLDLAFDAGGVRLTVGGVSAALPGVSADAPAWERVPPAVRGIHVDAATLARIDATVRVAAGDDITRPQLASVRVDDDGTAVATDGHRMHVARMFDAADAPAAATIPVDAWDVAARAGKDGAIMYTDGRRWHATAAHWWVTAPTVGNFPAWRQVMPDMDGNTARFMAGELAAAVAPHVRLVKQARTVVGTRINVNGSVTLATVAGDASAETSVPCVHVGGERRTALDVRYLADAADALTGEASVALPADPYRPIYLADATMQIVIMPMRV